MRSVFMGTPEFGVPSLFALLEISDIVGVITQPDRPAGRGRKLSAPPVKREAERLGLPVIQPKSIKARDALEALARWNPDVTVVAAYGQILPESVLYLPPAGSVNVHASLLPRWRGAAPIQAAILHGDGVSGITLMKMDAGLDTGPIIVQRELEIQEDETGGKLAARLSELGGSVLQESLTSYLAGERTPRPQDDSRATYAPMLKKSDGLLDPSEQAARLARKVRAFDPWPGTHLFVGGSRLGVLRASCLSTSSTEPPGRIVVVDDYPALTCSDGLLRLDIVQPAGKTPMPGDSYLRGAGEMEGQRVNLDQP